MPATGGFYAATKHAVKALTEVTRLELRARNSRSRVTAISPGFVETEFFEAYHGGDKEKGAETLAGYEKVLQPADIASAVIHVLETPGHVSIHDVLLRPTEQDN